MVKNFINSLKKRVLGRSKDATPDVQAPAKSDKPEAATLKPKRSHSSSKSAAKPERKAAAKPAPAWSLSAFKVAPVDGKVRFHDFAIPEPIMHAIDDLGFQYCTPIQAEVLAPATDGRDVAAQAQTGTGKTAAFLISVFTRYLNKPPNGDRPRGAPRALVIAPTRELVIQIAKDATALSKHCHLRCVAIYGGMDYDRQRRMLEQGDVDLIAATPGRLLDFVRQRAIDLSFADALVIDEADRMLDMGFIPDVRQIIRRLPPKDKRQTMLFSATLTDDVRRLAAQWMVNPVEAEVKPEQIAGDTVEQVIYTIRAEEKFTVLYNLLKQDAVKRVLVFGNRRDQTQRLADRLHAHGITCGLLSGAIAQNKRVQILEDFREGRIPVMVATDVAGRGIHVDGITHVVNYDFPYEADDYVHRIGRTGRAGADGVAISFACEDESFIIPDIEKYIGETLPCRQPDESLLAKIPEPIHSMPNRRSESAGGQNRRRSSGSRSGSSSRSRSGSRPRR